MRARPSTRRPGYALSQRKRKRVEEIFGSVKTIGGLRKTRYRGVPCVDWMFTFALAAYNLVRMRNLAPAPAEPSANERPRPSATVRSRVTDGLRPMYSPSPPVENSHCKGKITTNSVFPASASLAKIPHQSYR